jgi:hypothetical protein
MFLKSSLQMVKDVRTIQQQTYEDAMMSTMKKLFVRPAPTLLEDVAGVTVLFVLLFAGLTLSGTA